MTWPVIEEAKKRDIWYNKEEASSSELLEKEVWFYQAKNNDSA